MGCNCKWTEIILALILIVFSVLVVMPWSRWVVFVAGVVLLVHALMCKNCGPCELEHTKTKRKK